MTESDRAATLSGRLRLGGEALQGGDDVAGGGEAGLDGHFSEHH